MTTILLLVISNTFMTFAWYGHLKHKSAPIAEAILVSWLIAFGEYCFQVPANRIGYGRFSGYQLKVIQECVTLTVFVVLPTFTWESPSAGIMRCHSSASLGQFSLLFGAASIFRLFGFDPMMRFLSRTWSR